MQYSFILHFPNHFPIFIKKGKIVSPERSHVMENKSKGRVARAYRISDETVETLKAIADKENCTETAVIENAIRYYKDYLYMQTDGAFINESVKRTFLASVNLMETRLNNRTNKVLSELAIQQAIICQVLAHELEINPRALDNYRRAAVEYLKMNDRVFRLEDILEE
ncbi:hypothetical protein SUBVAR_07408 [Subdoligranulum variabile DSM 15176]|uniref:Uncharacterized protein n=2 Tax=Subdoligranulum variabile TaxID=214851 RepID=D1PSM6_9FIRM|nr:hypothetical protein SUBVAR_07408 [Subdoligranulum variabile DSM 15176]